MSNGPDIYPNIQVQIQKDAMNADLSLPPKLPKVRRIDTEILKWLVTPYK